MQDKANHGDAFGVFAFFKELRLRGFLVTLGEVLPAKFQVWISYSEGPRARVSESERRRETLRQTDRDREMFLYTHIDIERERERDL